LTCHDVLEELPGLEAGEPTSGDVHDHLASCRTCRAEAARVRVDLSRLRGELAALSPSPFLEERVLEAARSPTPVLASKAPRSSLRWGVFTGLAAAIVLAGVLIVANRAPEPEAGIAVETVAGEGDSDTNPSQVKVPGTALQVAGQRRKRYPLGSTSVRLLTLAGAPPKGIALLGQDLLARFLPDGMISLTDGLTDGLAKAEAALTQGGKQPYIDVWVSNPQTGAAALVRAQVSRMYTGSLLLEEPLARALGLEQHELPGHVTVAGDLSFKAYRTRARIRVADLDAVLEIQTRFAGDPHAADLAAAGDNQKEPRLAFVGERPDAAMVADRLSMRGDRLVMESATTTTFAKGAAAPAVLSLKKDATPSIVVFYREKDRITCSVVLPALDFGLGGPSSWRMTMQRVTLPQRFEPRAAIAIARVWRGATAIPSRESVAFTTADEKGRVSFVRTGRERGPLRLRERRKDGTVHWHTLRLDDEKALTRRLIVTVDSRGALALGPLHRLLPVGRNTFAPPWEPKVLAALRENLSHHAEAAGREVPHGPSRLVVVVRAATGASWQSVERVVQACARLDVKIDKLSFEVDGAKDRVPYRLPTDRGLSPAIPAPKQQVQTLVLSGSKAGVVHWHWLQRAAKGGMLRTPEDWTRVRASLAGWVREAEAEGTPLTVHIRADRSLPFSAVREALARCRIEGVREVVLVSSVPR